MRTSPSNPRSSSSRGRRAAALATVAALVLVACGGDDDGSGAPDPAPAVITEADDVAGSPGLALAGFETLDGDTFDASVVEGHPTVLWFWAPWCVICRAEGPHLADAAEAHADELRIIGVPGRDAIGPMERFVADTGTADLTHVVDPDGTVWAEFGVFGQPAFAFIDADGEMEVFVGSLGSRGLDERIERLLTA